MNRFVLPLSMAMIVVSACEASPCERRAKKLHACADQHGPDMRLVPHGHSIADTARVCEKRLAGAGAAEMREKLECSRSHQDCRQLVECILNVSDKYHGDDPVELPPKLIEALERLHDLRPGKAPPPKK